MRTVLAFALALAGCARSPAPQPVPPEPAPAEPTPREDPAVLTLGVIVSAEGPQYLRAYASPLIEGIRIAAATHEQAGGQRVNLLVREDSGRAARAASIMREFERADAIGVIGPLTDAAVRAAAAARTNTDVTIIAPLATTPSALSNVYALNVEDTLGAAALGEYAGSRRLRTGVLHARGPRFTADARAFAHGVVRRGGAQTLLQPFDSGTTSFAIQIRRLRDAGVRAVYIAAPMSDLRQILPQLSYYGLGGIQLFGGELWNSEEFLRAVPSNQTEDAIIATVLPRSTNSIAWSEFEELYGRTYRRSPSSAIPALGYDAARIILQSSPRGRVTPRDVAEGIARAGRMRGATGSFRLEHGVAIRQPFLMRVENGALVPVAVTGGT